jgi:hypothetical protein
MIQCKKLPESDCKSRKDCVFVNGLKRKYCRRKCLTRKKQSNLSNKNIRNNENCIETNKNVINAVELKNNNDKKLTIKEADFILDPCKLLNKFNQYLNNNLFNFRDLVRSKKKEFTKMLPRISKNGNDYKLNKKELKIFNQIAQGSYGEVYRVEYDNTNTIIKIPKIDEDEDEDEDKYKFIIESLIHNTLFCHFRGDFGDGARIPKIRFLANINFQSQKTFVTGMDEVDIDGKQFLSVEKDLFKQFDMMTQITEFLVRLQKDFQFMHKDLHIGNIMCKKSKRGEYRWYIIDFGQVSMNVNGQYYHSVEDFPYKKKHTYNPSHDMRLLISSIYGNVLKKQKLNETLTPFEHIISAYGSIVEKYIQDNQVFFWGAYGDIVDIFDKAFLPENIYNVFMEAKMSLKMGRLNTFIQDELSSYLKYSNNNNNTNNTNNTNNNSNSTTRNNKNDSNILIDYINKTKLTPKIRNNIKNYTRNKLSKLRKNNTIKNKNNTIRYNTRNKLSKLMKNKNKNNIKN